METWKDIKGYEGLYKISDKGRIKSYHTRGDRQKVGKEHYITPTKTTTGYYKIELMKEHKRRTYKLHRLIAIAFIPNPLKKPYINHIDGNKLNNSISNLEWCTQKENMNHAYKTGLIPKNTISKQEFYELYVVKHKGISEISKITHIGYNRVKEYLKLYGIKRHIGRKYDIPIEKLKRDFESGLTNKEISNKYNCSTAIIATRKNQYKKGLL